MSGFHVASIVLYSVIGSVSLLFAGMYLFRRSIMPYHAQALGTTHEALDPSLQVVLTAMMRVVGAGFLAAAVAVALFLSSPRHLFTPWGRIALPAIALPVSLGSIVATLNVHRRTRADTPWRIALAVPPLLALAALLSWLAPSFG